MQKKKNRSIVRSRHRIPFTGPNLFASVCGQNILRHIAKLGQRYSIYDVDAQNKFPIVPDIDVITNDMDAYLMHP